MKANLTCPDCDTVQDMNTLQGTRIQRVTCPQCDTRLTWSPDQQCFVADTETPYIPSGSRDPIKVNARHDVEIWDDPTTHRLMVKCVKCNNATPFDRTIHGNVIVGSRNITRTEQAWTDNVEHLLTSSVAVPVRATGRVCAVCVKTVKGIKVLRDPFVPSKPADTILWKDKVRIDFNLSLNTNHSQRGQDVDVNGYVMRELTRRAR